MEKEDFYQRVFEVVRMIPRGKVTTYGAIAKSLGVASAARMVGYALNASISSKELNDLPCHRVVNRNGELTGKIHFGPGTMKYLLENEGIHFKNQDTIDIKNHFWNPEL